uniref:Photosystem II cytochrome c550 n=1 Tax=Candidatus Kentrum sp. MB TaxID=2138164 RepID=A0A450XQZ4_9GAMM|nr:MAG: photosystem II cytochrome c550 [Candidatus Kentron sp. MB]
MKNKLALTCLMSVCLLGHAMAADFPENARTVSANEAGKTTVLTNEQVAQGKKLFVDKCSSCHAGGNTKTNPNVGLSLKTLALATPRRDNLAGLVDYMRNPTTYDGEIEISELHPSTKSADVFPEMRNITEDDLHALAGYMLVAPQLNKNWGGRSDGR